MEQMRYAGCRTKSRMPLRSSGLRLLGVPDGVRAIENDSD